MTITWLWETVSPSIVNLGGIFVVIAVVAAATAVVVVLAESSIVVATAATAAAAKVVVVAASAVVVLDVVSFTVDFVLVCNLWLKCTNDKLLNPSLVITLPHNEALYCLGYAMQ